MATVQQLHDRLVDVVGTLDDEVRKNAAAIANITPTNDGTITIVQPGTTAQTFTVNQSSNTTITLKNDNTTYDRATTAADGLMAKEDKAKLDGLTNYELPAATATVLGGIKITVGNGLDYQDQLLHMHEATTTIKGGASFNAAHFEVTSGEVSLKTPVVAMTLAQYSALTAPDANTLYVVTP